VSYVPRKGDFVIVSFDPQAGHEQHGRRPALVVSNDLFNDRTGLCIACPITTTARSYPFHVPIPEGVAISGVVMVDQVKSIDFRARGVKRVGPAPTVVLEHVLAILDACIF
jgi:mRNA interferase MazF